VASNDVPLPISIVEADLCWIGCIMSLKD
jgi:hypothetical protein